ncbi:hypothetical protein GCM10023221_37340 [Luteimicrobium xylanilyticum]|uniref:Uncharacterized protein n=1 Tax=Luteimicrobium xylanilyticum TaxID=1133546 RepID=A0A5P9QDG1_9MICO|nr:hypothetical protein [Luteimicrobium xylanilyticum]QFU99518.1 hypothetical protein KDY119_03049 [Luteimicrobium xylanilyticum]
MTGPVAPLASGECPASAPIKIAYHTAWGPDSYTYSHVSADACYATFEAAQADGYWRGW